MPLSSWQGRGTFIKTNIICFGLSSKRVFLVLILTLLTACASTPISFPNFIWPATKAGRIASISAPSRAEILRAEDQYYKAYRESNLKHRLSDSFSSGIGWSFSQEELIPSVRLNLLKAIERPRQSGFADANYIQSHKAFLVKIERSLDDIEIAEKRLSYRQKVLELERTSFKDKPLKIEQREMDVFEAQKRLTHQWRSLTLLTGINKDQLTTLVNCCD